MDEQPAIGNSFDIGRALNHGLLAIRIAAAPMWVAGLLMSISDGCSGRFANPSSLMGKRDQAGAWMTSPPRPSQLLEQLLADEGLRGALLGVLLGIVLVGTLIGLGLFAFQCWLQTGFVRLHVNILEHASDELAPLFTGKDRFRAMLGYKTLSALSIWAALLISAWPGALLAYYGFATKHSALLYGGLAFVPIFALPVVLYVALGNYLGALAVALDAAPPVHALRRSWALAHENRVPLFGFAFVCALLQLVGYAGILLCCVGVLATLPLAYALIGFAKTESYLLFTRGREQTAGWRAWQLQAVDDRVDEGTAWNATRDRASDQPSAPPSDPRDPGAGSA